MMSTKIRRLVTGAALSAVIVPSAFIGAPGAASAALPRCTTIVYHKDAQVPASSSGSISCLLRRGNTGMGVSMLQNSLVACNDEDIAIDGIFGPATEAAVKRVQRRHKIEVDGIYGPQTRRAMEHMSASGITCRSIR